MESEQRGPRRWARRAALLAGTAALAVLVAALALGAWAVRRPFPRVEGTLRLAALDGPVDVHRDELGVPTIVGTTSLDVFRAQGFVHAQDRFWQMDVWRHIGRGRTAELFGPEQLDTDRFLRTLGWERVAEAELALLEPATRAMLGAYAEGVNAYLEDRPAGAVSLEYTVLGLQRPGYTPRPWEPVDSLVLLKLMAWDLRNNLDAEIERAVLTSRLGEERVADLYPPYDRAPVIVERPGALAAAGTRSPRPGLPPAAVAASARLAARVAAVDELTGRAGEAMASNSWVVSGGRSATGAPILANDPHLAIQMPSIWYQVALRCAARTPACVDDVTGFSFASLPGVVIGHNGTVAWGLTSLGADVMDLYVERLNPDDPYQYEVDGEWVDMEVVEETLRRGDGTLETLEVRRTRHGPIVSDTYGPAGDVIDGGTHTGAPAAGPYALALRWTALEPSRTLDALPALNRARGWEDFRAAAALFDVPVQNLVYADVGGTIGYQAPGRIPIRGAGDGRMPAPGWRSAYDWTGFVPFDDLPRERDPERGWIVTANNPVVGDGFPYRLGTDWDYGFRAARIADVLTGRGGGITLDDVQELQLDTRTPGSGWLLPALLAVDAGGAGSGGDAGARIATAQRALAGWDGDTAGGSAAAAVYQATWRHLLARVFHPHLPEEHHPEGGSRWVEVVRRLLDDPDSPWWDDPGRDGRQRRDGVLAAAMADAVAELEDRLGDDPARWRWADLHRATFRNTTLGESGVALVEDRFNRGPYPVGGADEAVNAVGWDPSVGYEVDWLPSMRMIIDLGDLDRSRAIHTTGQSGHAYHRDYTSMVDLWRQGRQRDLPWDLDRITASAEAHLRLEP